uniref:Uncharacterized protein n=1 Tax=Panagrolaimus superbus TaxID=310955 RepID=A0A914Z7W1_9BILA
MASDEIDFIDLKQTLRELADKGVSFELFKYRVNFKNIQVCGADYRYHKRVHDMPSPYPKQWDKTKVVSQLKFYFYTVIHK